MACPLAFFVGSVASFNVQRLVTNVGWMLEGTAPLHLITTEGKEFDDESLGHFETVTDEYPSSLRGEVRALRDYLGSYDPAAITQLTHPPVHGTIVGLAARRAGVPFVYRYSGDRFYEFKVATGKQRFTGFALGNLLGRIPLPLADRHIVLGPHGKRQLTTRGVSSETVTILPPSVDETRFRDASAATVDIPAGRKMVLFVGRLSRLKGLETIRTTLPRILDRREDLQFVFVGERELTLSLSERNESHVTVCGPVLPSEITGYYHQASLLIHPSLTEGVPRAVLESLAAGTPVAVRDVGDVASVTENTFSTDEEFIDMVSSLEELPLDDVTPFTRKALQSQYCDFFGSFE